MRIRHDTVILERRFVPQGHIIIREGDNDHQAYLIQSGEVSVYITKEGIPVELSRLGTGDIVGEMAIIGQGLRSASVRALSDCNLIIISRPQFEEKLRDTDPTIRAIVRMLVRRIKDANSAFTGRKETPSVLKQELETLYFSYVEGMDRAKLKNFEAIVKPRYEALIEALDLFSDRYSD
jgi:CRP-like cAMP-binding protein